MPYIPAKNRSYYICVALLMADAILFGLIDPRRASAATLFIGFVLLGATIWSLLRLISIGPAKTLMGSSHGSRRLSRYLALGLTILIGLQSVGQLTFKDVVAILPLIIIAYAYFGYGKRRERAVGATAP